MAKLDERQLNLMFLLLNSSSPVPKHVIFERVPGYTEGSQEAIDKSFDRDKKALRKQGIDIKMQSPDELFTVDYGYYIERDRVLLPEIKLSTRERELISMASYVWHDLQLSQAAHIAGRTIGNALVETDLDAPHIGPQEHLLALIEAVSASRIVQFDYRKPTAEESSSRRLEPWRIFCTGGAWYVIGWDVDNDRDSTFRLSRITGSVTATEDPIVHAMPPDLDVAAVVESWKHLGVSSVSATVLVDPDTCLQLRAMARSVTTRPDGDVLELRAEFEPALISAIAAVCQHVTVINPPRIRDGVLDAVKKAAGE